MWRKTILTGISLALVILLAGCDSGASSRNAEGNQLFADGKLDEALEAYQNAQVVDPDAPQPHYNAGNVLHRQEAYTEAITETLNALNGADSALANWVDYNVGNSEFRLEQYEQAIERYKAALRANPDDVDAKLNLEIAQQRLEQQQQDQQQDQQQQDQQQNQGQRATPTPTPTPTPQSGEQQQPSAGQGTPTPSPEEPEQVPAGPSAADLENMSREQALQLLGALAQDDQTLQEYLQKLQPTPSNPNVRDW